MILVVSRKHSHNNFGLETVGEYMNLNDSYDLDYDDLDYDDLECG